MTTPTNHHNTTTAAACVWCIDGWTPAGIHPVLGPVYRACPTEPACDTCADTSVFPADLADPREIALQLLSHGLALVLCPSCLGVSAVIPLTNGGGIR